MNSDIVALANWAQSQGWRVEDDSRGYTRFFDPEGNYVTNYPATPGRANRRLADLRVALKKAGLAIPPPSKKELKSLRKKTGERT